MKLRDWIDILQQQGQIAQAKRTNELLEEQNKYTQKYFSEVQSQIREMEIFQQEQLLVRNIESTIQLIVEQERAIERTINLTSRIEKFLKSLSANTPENSNKIELPADILNEMLPLKSLFYKTNDVLKYVKSLKKLSINLSTSQQLKNLRDVQDELMLFTSLIDSYNRFQQIIVNHPISEIEACRMNIKDYLETGKSPIDLKDLLMSVEEMRDNFDSVANYTDIKTYFCDDDVPMIFLIQRDKLKVIKDTLMSFYDANNTKSQLSDIKKLVLLNLDLNNTEDKLISDCQQLDDFNKLYGDNNPIKIKNDFDDVPDEIRKLTKRIEEEKNKIVLSTQGIVDTPALTCFEMNLSRAENLIKSADKVLNDYYGKPRSRFSGWAITTIIFAIISIFWNHNGIIAVIVGHIALYKIKWNRGKIHTIISLIVGYITFLTFLIKVIR